MIAVRVDKANVLYLVIILETLNSLDDQTVDFSKLLSWDRDISYMEIS